MDTANKKTSEDDNSPWINSRKTLREGWGVGGIHSLLVCSRVIYSGFKMRLNFNTEIPILLESTFHGGQILGVQLYEFKYLLD